MEIQFTQSRPQSARLVAQVTDKGKVPADLDKAMVEGMEAARFKGGAGQVFEGFVERDGQVLRLAIAGTGDRNDEARPANLEKAGAALAAKYQSSGNEELVLDLTNSGLSGEEAACVLLGLRLRSMFVGMTRAMRALMVLLPVEIPEGIEGRFSQESVDLLCLYGVGFLGTLDATY